MNTLVIRPARAVASLRFLSSSPPPHPPSANMIIPFLLLLLLSSFKLSVVTFLPRGGVPGGLHDRLRSDLFTVTVLFFFQLLVKRDD